MKTNETTLIPQGYKATPLGIIPQEWEVKRFMDTGNFLRNNTLPRDKMSESDGCVQNIHYGDVLIKYREILNVSKTNIPWIVENSKDSPLGDMLQNGDIVISDTAEDYTVGKATEMLEINSASVVAGLHTMPFRPLPDLFSPCFLGYYVNSMAYRFQLYSLIQGIKVCAISKKAIGGTFLIVPPLAEQKKIAEVLGLWDKAIEKQSQLIEQLTLRKRGLMQQLLTGKKRLFGFSGEWKKEKAGSIFENSSVRSNKSEPLLSATQEYGVVPRDMLETRVTMPSGNLSSFKRVNIGDFVISLRSFEGGIEYSKYSGIVSPAYTVLKKKHNVNDIFYKAYFKSHEFIQRLAIAVIGIRDGKQISYSDFCYIRIPLPSIEEQTAIAQVLTAADREIELAQQRLELLRQQKRGLMQQLLTGKKRVKY